MQKGKEWKLKIDYIFVFKQKNLRRLVLWRKLVPLINMAATLVSQVLIYAFAVESLILRTYYFYFGTYRLGMVREKNEVLFLIWSIKNDLWFAISNSLIWFQNMTTFFSDGSVNTVNSPEQVFSLVSSKSRINDFNGVKCIWLAWISCNKVFVNCFFKRRS